MVLLFSTAASIRMNVDGAPGVGDMPGRIGFFYNPGRFCS
jgi:hypothetical protein